MIPRIGWPLALATLLAFAACDKRSAVSSDATADGLAAPDGSMDGPVGPDHGALDLALGDLAARDLPPLLDAPRDAGTSPDQDACFCGPGEVWLRGSCVPTLELGCGPTCDPSSPSSCPAGLECDQWAAAPCCVCSAAVPACVQLPTTGAISGPLRMTPTSGVAGQSVTFTIEGAPFYVGALFYMVRMGNEQTMDQPANQPCTTTATFTPPNPGIFAVEVSQYGGGAPWVLAGFYTASGGSIPMPTIQPGYPCATNPAPGDPPCASATPYTCTCVAGRCQCQ